MSREHTAQEPEELLLREKLKISTSQPLNSQELYLVFLIKIQQCSSRFGKRFVRYRNTIIHCLENHIELAWLVEKFKNLHQKDYEKIMNYEMSITQSQLEEIFIVQILTQVREILYQKRNELKEDERIIAWGDLIGVLFGDQSLHQQKLSNQYRNMLCRNNLLSLCTDDVSKLKTLINSKIQKSSFEEIKEEVEQFLKNKNIKQENWQKFLECYKTRVVGLTDIGQLLLLLHSSYLKIRPKHSIVEVSKCVVKLMEEPRLAEVFKDLFNIDRFKNSKVFALKEEFLNFKKEFNIDREKHVDSKEIKDIAEDKTIGHIYKKYLSAIQNRFPHLNLQTNE